MGILKLEKKFDGSRLQKTFRMKPTQIIILSFVLMVVIGTFFLMLPISTTNNLGLNFFDALFVATSASCVVGLTVVDVHNDLTLFGQVVMVILIQIGGLGIMTLATLVIHTMGYRFRLKETLILQESLNQRSQAGLVTLIARIIKYTFVIEGFFAVLLTIHFVPEFGAINAVGYGIFHSVSSFCNAGFDLFGNYDSLCGRGDDFFLLTCIGSLILLGNTGFTVIYDVIHRRKWKKFSLHTKIVIVMNFALVFIGGAVIFAVESLNPYTLEGLPLSEQIAQSVFTSVSCRTAGMNTFVLNEAEQITMLTMILLMFIGAAPLSTGGGIKSTTFFVIVMSMWAVFRGKDDIVVFGRRISDKIRDQAFAIFTMGTIWVVTAAMILSAIDGEVHKLTHVLFETVSAFATVGMGVGVTSEWDDWGKLILVLTMLVGRVGIMTFMLSLITQHENRIKYPPEDIMIG
ncbi:MAG: Trk family potassium uptake protein [Selenomonadaceae bacterium]|nr:Trk family potassium uptake protein [Selenomonadaceae bacterium]